MGMRGEPFREERVSKHSNIIAIFEEIKEKILDLPLENDKELIRLLLSLEDLIRVLDYSSIIAVTDDNGIIIDANDTFCKISQYSKEELIGNNHRLLKSGYHSPEFYKNMWDTINSGRIWEGEIKNKKKNGHFYWVKTTIFPFLDQHGEPYKFISIRTDITKGKKYEERLRETIKNDFSQVVKSLHNLVFKVKKAKEGYVYTLFEGLLGNKMGFDTKVVFGKKPEEIFPQEVAATLVGHFNKAFLGKVHSFELYANQIWFHTTLSPIFQNNEVIELIGSTSDVTELKKSELKVKHMAYHNQLTNMPNRYRLDEDLLLTLQSAEKDKEPVAIMMLDLDHFKHINDSCGHTVGDNILQQVAVLLKEIHFPLVEEKRVYHLGGDEFILVTKGFDLAHLDDIVHQLITSFERPFHYNELEFHVSVSVGISIYPESGANAEELLKFADTALFVAKDLGRNTFQVYTPKMNEQLIKKLVIEKDLRRALAENEFVLYYQPQLDIHTNEIIGLEALIRWNHPENGFISPIDFIPIAEETGLINPIGDWVLRNACMQMKKWQEEGIDFLKVSVNIATSHFQRRDFYDNVIEILSSSGLDGSFLDLEITESSLMENTESTIGILKKLREHNIQISIDDFGTGYSSLGYLKSFPITTLKIDQSFVRDLTTNYDDRAIVATIVNLSKNLRLKVVAEGVETKEALDFLRLEKCDVMQGYLFSRPLPAEEIPGFINKFQMQI